MENEELENDNSQIVDEVENTDSQNSDEQEDDSTGDSDESSQEEYTDREKQMYARMKKAEGFVQVDGKWVKSEKPAPKAAPKAKQSKTEMSHFDLLSLNKANIETQEDLDEVVRWADYNKISVSEALESNILKATIAEKAEKRASANAVNTGTGRRASGQVSDERLLSDAATNKLPTSEADIARLARLKFQNK